MSETFAQIFTIGGKTNSLGRSSEVIEEVLRSPSRLEELYNCLFDQDAWVRMRAADSLEKICRSHPEWFVPYVERLFKEVAPSMQPSLQWHLAQMLTEITLAPTQQKRAVRWLAERLRDKNVDWIVAGNAMDALLYFVKEGAFTKEELIPLVKLQQNHHSKAVVRRAGKLLNKLET